MIWKALDNLLERINKLEEEVFLLKPLKLQDKDIPEIYITTEGKALYLKEGEELRTIFSPFLFKENVDLIHLSLDGIKMALSNLEITQINVLLDPNRKLKLILFSEKAARYLLSKEESIPKAYRSKVSFLQELISKYNIDLVLSNNNLLEQKLSSF